MSQQLASLAWERYRETVGNLSFERHPLPPWGDLGERQKAGWRAAVEAVLQAERPPTVAEEMGL
jgi:hypothetical protein